MKILHLRKKAIINFSISGILLIMLGAIIFYNSSQKAVLQSKINQTKSETSRIKAQTEELQTKEAEIKKYLELWKQIEHNKKSVSGIKMDNVNTILDVVSAKYNVKNTKIKVTLPETLKEGIFNRKTVNILYTTAALEFQTVTDIAAISFVVEFINSLPGYVIIDNLEIKKSKPQYSEQDFVDIASGKSAGLINGKIDFFWYVYKNKETETKQPEGNQNNLNAIQGTLN